MYVKDENARLDYVMDWTEACAGVRTIASSQWSVEPAGLGLDPHATEATRATVELSGGTVGALYRVTNMVGFSDGLVDARMLVVRVEKR